MRWWQHSQTSGPGFKCLKISLNSEVEGKDFLSLWGKLKCCSQRMEIFFRMYPNVSANELKVSSCYLGELCRQLTHQLSIVWLRQLTHNCLLRSLASWLCCHSAFVAHDSNGSHFARYSCPPQGTTVDVSSLALEEGKYHFSHLNIPKQVLGVSDSRCKNCSLMDSPCLLRPSWKFRT